MRIHFVTLNEIDGAPCCRRSRCRFRRGPPSGYDDISVRHILLTQRPIVINDAIVDFVVVVVRMANAPYAGMPRPFIKSLTLYLVLSADDASKQSLHRGHEQRVAGRKSPRHADRH